MSQNRSAWSKRAKRSLATLSTAALLGVGFTVPAYAAAGEVFISEIHYDNDGTDTGEAIEVQAPDGSDLTGWQVVLYNGSGSTVYDSTELTGTIPRDDADGPDGAVSLGLETNGLQNGSPDGIALIDPQGAVAEFLSYEGELTAADGPAEGQTSTDIGVVESNSTPAGQSLQRIDGAWQGPLEESFGAVNTAPADGGDGNDGGDNGDGDDGTQDPPSSDTVSIAEIQGNGAESPLVGQMVTTNGVVTGVYATGGFDGYYIQTAGTGGDAAPADRQASQAVFVYSPATVGDVAVGDHVQVTGGVSEYNGLTEINVDAGGMTVLADAASVDPLAQFTLPAGDAAREKVEGMLVAPTSDYVVSDTYALGGWGDSAFGSIGLGLGGPLVTPSDVAAPGTAAFDDVVADNAARSVTLDDGQSARTSQDEQVPYLTGAPDLRTGVGVTFHEPVIVDYRFQWNFQPTTPVAGNAEEMVTFSGGNTREANAAPEDVGGDLTIATFNVLNYFTTLGEDVAGCDPYTDRAGNPLTVRGGCDLRGAWNEESLQRQEGKIVAAINGLDADVVALEEIENSAKFGKDRDAALADLVEALNADAGEQRWAYAPSPADLPALAEQDVIRTAFIYNPAAVELAGESVVLTGTSGEDPFDIAREPLAQVFTAVGTDYSFLAVANHFKSKGGDCEPNPAGCHNADRVAQANALTDFAASVAASAGVTDTFLLGDFNAYSEEDPVHAIEDAGYTNVSEGEPTYVYDGAVGSLDHVFAGESAAENVTGVDVWRINAVESVLHEYSRYNYFASDLFQAGSVYRASDHDPILVGIDVPQTTPPDETGPVNLDILSINDFHGRIEANRQSAGAAVLSCAVQSFEDQNPNTLFVSAGDNIGASTFTSFIADDVPTMDVLNAIGLDVSSFGNHEFDKGQDDVTGRVLPYVNWPYLGANVLGPDGEPAFAGPENGNGAYWVTETDGVSVGFIGLLTEEMPSLVSPSGIEGLTFADLQETANQYATQLSDGDASNGEADVIVVLVHDGAPTPELSSADGTPFGELVAGASEEIDAIISGHTHQAYVHNVDGMWVTQTGKYGENLGHLSLTVDPETGEVTESAAENIDLVPQVGDEEAGIPRETYCEGDPEVQQIVDEAIANADELGSQPLGEITADFNRAVQSDGSENRGGESTLGNFVAEVQLWAAQRTNPDAQIALMNPGGLRADMTYEASGDEGDGVLTYKEAAIVQPFANTLVTTVLSGAQLEQVLEEQWQPESASRPFLKLGVSEGFSYTYDPDAPKGEHITQMMLNGEPVTADGQYTVVVNSFLAAGGDNFTTLTEGTNTTDTGQTDLAAMVDYMAEFGTVSPDYAQRAVAVNWVSDPSAEYAAGDEIAIDLASLAFSTGEPVPEQVQVTLGGQEVGTAPVDPAIVDTTDLVGQAQVRVQVPEGLSGTVDLVISDSVNGTTVNVPITIAADDGGGDDGGDQPGGWFDDILDWLKGLFDDILDWLFPWLP